jgi:hypothetical protein
MYWQYQAVTKTPRATNKAASLPRPAGRLPPLLCTKLAAQHLEQKTLSLARQAARHKT